MTFLSIVVELYETNVYAPPPPMVIWASRVMYGVSCPKQQGLPVFALPSDFCNALHENENHPVTFSSKHIESRWLISKTSESKEMDVISSNHQNHCGGSQWLTAPSTFFPLALWPSTPSLECQKFSLALWKGEKIHRPPLKLRYIPVHTVSLRNDTMYQG